MAITYREVEELRLTTRKNLALSKERWTQFLTTASNTYKYSYDEQMLIFAQFPKAKAVAAFDVWSKKFGRRIRYNEKGIGLIDDTKSYPKMKYVFDISQSNRFKDVPQPYIWDLKDEYKQEAAVSLSGEDKSIDEALSDLAENTVEAMIDGYVKELLSKTNDSAALAGLDDDTITSEFRQLVADSVNYMTLKRCGLDTSLYMDDNAFENLNVFSEPGITDILGGTVSDISEQVLRQVEQTVNSIIERSNKNERTNEENQNNQRDTIHSERGRYEVLSDSDRGQRKWTDLHSRPENIRVLSESQRDGGHEGHRNLGTEEKKVSQREQTDTVYADVRRPQPDRPFDRSQRVGGATDGNAPRTDDEIGGSDGRTESTRPDEVGQNDELNQSESGRNRTEQSDLRIKNNTDMTEAEESVSPASFHFTDSEPESFEQVGFFESEPSRQIDYPNLLSDSQTKKSTDNITAGDVKKLIGDIPENAEIPQSESNVISENVTESEQSITVGNSIEYDDKIWTIKEIDEDNNRIVLERETGNIIIPHESMDLFLSDVINSVSKSQTPENTEVGQVVQVESIANAEKSFAEQVDDVLSGQTPFYSALKVCDTPDILLDIGCRQLPMLYTQKHLKNAIKEKDRREHTHGLSVEQIKRLPELIENPLMIMDSVSNNNSIVIVTTETDADNLPVMVSVKPNGKGKYELEELDSNFITSVYGRNNFDKFFERTVKADCLLYCNKKSQQLFERWGEQYSELTKSFGFDTIIHQSRNIVNENPVVQTAENTHKSDSLSQSQTPENTEVGQVVRVEPDTTRTAKNQRPTITCEWSESSAFEDGKTYTVSEFDRIMKQADDDWVKQRQYELDTYGNDMGKIYEAYEKSEIEGVHQGFAKTKFTIHLPDGSSCTERQDIGDGDGGLIDYLKHFPQYTDVVDVLVADIQKNETAQNTYHITDNALGAGKQSEKYQNNINAIKTLKSIEAENRTATKDEQELLSKYVGWGGLSPVFQPNHKCYNELKNLLTDSEYEQARKSTMTAFYTSPVIIREMYNKLADMGFKDGKLLEPSCGVGNFIGTIPDNINAKVTGVELDSITGRIAKQLYPDADIQVCGFENSNLKENSFDVAVGNVPFGDIRVYDKKYNKDNLLIHDYFFSKSLDMVKPGGVVAFITSKGTLDKQNDNARRLIAEKAEFLGAVRLPNNAFKANAGTDVTSDIIFLQKRTEPVEITLDNEPLWIKTAKDENGIEMNAYFAENPQQICGTMEMQSTQYGFDSTCVPDTSTKLSEQIRNAMQNINGTISTEKAIEEEFENFAESVAVPSNLRNSSFFFSDGKPYFYENNTVTDVQLPKKEKSSDRLKGMIVIRDTVRQLLDMQLDENTTDDEIKAVQNGLSNFYDDFTVKFGRLNSKENTNIFKNDSSLPLLKSLEKTNQQGEFIGKADIFSKRTVKAQKTVTSVPSSVDALAVSLSETAKVDLDYMARLTGFDKDKIVSDLKGAIFPVPDSDKYVTADEYLSGNILTKLEEARKAFDNGDNRFAENISALNKSMPKKLEAGEIDVRLGATWIKPEYIRQFVFDLLGTSLYHNNNKIFPKEYIDVQYSDITGKWFITNKSSDKENIHANTTYGTKDKSAYQLIEDALNLKSTTVKKREEINGKEQSVVDRNKTVAVQAKQDLIKEKFKEWIFADKDRRDDIVNTYNRLFNTTRNREYDGKYLNFVGMNPEIELRPHQLNAVARCLYGGNTLLAHEVGAGKTFEMIAAAMEGKRLGLHNKSMFCVPNHLTEQIGADFLKLYPNANILVATKKDFEKQNRKNLMAKIATGNYDAVIIGHSQLSMIPISPERQKQFIQNQINEVVLGIQELKAGNGERFQIKQMEKTKQNLETKITL